MTMHLERTLTSINTRRRKNKITKRQLQQYMEDHLAFNRRMKQSGRHSERMTLEQYIDSRFGRGKVRDTGRDYRPQPAYHRETPEIASVADTVGVCAKPRDNRYTGSLVTGIATMHKSNAVPVINQEQAKDISRMRRG